MTLEFWVPLEKAQAFADACKDLFGKGKATRREIAAVVGKLMWWNPAIFNVKLLSKALQQQTGGINSAQYGMKWCNFHNWHCASCSSGRITQ